MSEIEENSAKSSKSSCRCSKLVILSSTGCPSMAPSLAGADSRLRGLSINTKIAQFGVREQKKG